MKKILVPTDFSELAHNALEYAVNLAKLSNGEVILLHVYDVPVVVGDYPTTAVTVEDMEKMSREKLSKMKRELLNKHGDSVKFSDVVGVGFVSDIIEEQVEKNDIDLIVMGVTGAGKLSELLLGSNTTRVINNLDCPTLTVPASAKYQQINSIAFACDYDNLEDSTAIDELSSLVKFFDAKLKIVNIGKRAERKTYEQELSGRLLEYIFENVNESLNVSNDIDYSIHKRKDDDIVHGINKFVDKHKVDLLVMIPRKHSFFEKLFHESNTKKMAFHSHVPLLTLHDKE